MTSVFGGNHPGPPFSHITKGKAGSAYTIPDHALAYERLVISSGFYDRYLSIQTQFFLSLIFSSC